jgi:hypothetical protein
MNISLPLPIQAWVEAQAGRAGKTAEEYVVQVLVDEMSDPGTSDMGVDELAAFRHKIEEKALEAIAGGPAVEVTPEFWEERHRVLTQRLAVQK